MVYRSFYLYMHQMIAAAITFSYRHPAASFSGHLLRMGHKTECKVTTFFPKHQIITVFCCFFILKKPKAVPQVFFYMNNPALFAALSLLLYQYGRNSHPEHRFTIYSPSRLRVGGTLQGQGKFPHQRYTHHTITANIKITGISNHFSLISLNIYALNSPIKRHD